MQLGVASATHDCQPAVARARFSADFRGASAAAGGGTRLAEGLRVMQTALPLAKDSCSHTAGAERTPSLFTATQGSVSVEYVVAVAFLGIMAALALAAVGPAKVRLYSLERNALYEPYP